MCGEAPGRSRPQYPHDTASRRPPARSRPCAAPSRPQCQALAAANALLDRGEKQRRVNKTRTERRESASLGCKPQAKPQRSCAPCNAQDATRTLACVSAGWCTRHVRLQALERARAQEELPPQASPSQLADTLTTGGGPVRHGRGQKRPGNRVRTTRAAAPPRGARVPRHTSGGVSATFFVFRRRPDGSPGTTGNVGRERERRMAANARCQPRNSPGLVERLRVRRSRRTCSEPAVPSAPKSPARLPPQQDAEEEKP